MISAGRFDRCDHLHVFKLMFYSPYIRSHTTDIALPGTTVKCRRRVRPLQRMSIADRASGICDRGFRRLPPIDPLCEFSGVSPDPGDTIIGVRPKVYEPIGRTFGELLGEREP